MAALASLPAAQQMDVHTLNSMLACVGQLQTADTAAGVSALLRLPAAQHLHGTSSTMAAGGTAPGALAQGSNGGTTAPAVVGGAVPGGGMQGLGDGSLQQILQTLKQDGMMPQQWLEQMMR